MPTTQEIRNWWSPACTGPFTRVELFGEGAVSVDHRIVGAVKALDQCLAAHSYATRKGDTGAYNCRKITGGSGYSLHAYGIALDINWQSNPYGANLVTDMPGAMVAAIKGIRTNNGKQVWRWGGDYSGNKDAMHYEIVCSPADIATGIAGSIPNDTEDIMNADQEKALIETRDNVRKLVIGLLDTDALAAKIAAKIPPDAGDITPEQIKQATGEAIRETLGALDD